MIAIYECGCIGMPTLTDNGNPFILVACDTEDDGWAFRFRDRMKYKAYTPLKREAQIALMEQIKGLVIKGLAFDRIKRALETGGRG